jgi:hypothetical protein
MMRAVKRTSGHCSRMHGATGVLMPTPVLIPAPVSHETLGV